MGYTHYWNQKRPFTKQEWATILAESMRICAKAERGDYYTGKEDFASATRLELDANGFRTGFAEDYAWRTFAHPEVATPMQGAAIALADSCGQKGTRPAFTEDYIALNGVAPKEDYETFWLDRAPTSKGGPFREQEAKDGIFNFCKTEYRPYDAVVVSILHMARTVAPDAITVSSDGGPEAIKLMF